MRVRIHFSKSHLNSGKRHGSSSEIILDIGESGING